MSKIQSHPIYDKYEFDANTGKYRMIGSVEWMVGSLTGYGSYRRCSISSTISKKQKSMLLHRAMWESFNGPISDKQPIDHIDNNGLNNKLLNLQCITIKENNGRRNHDFLRVIQKTARTTIKRAIKSTNIETGENHVFKTQCKCARYFGCSPALVYLICEKKNKSKTYMKKYTFEYTDETVNTIVQDARVGKTYVTKKIKKTEDEKKADRSIAMKKYNAKKKAEKLAIQTTV